MSDQEIIEIRDWQPQNQGFLPSVKCTYIDAINSKALKNNPGRRHKSGRLEERDFKKAYKHMIRSMPVKTSFQKIKLLLVVSMVILFKQIDITIDLEDDIRSIKTNNDMIRFILVNSTKLNKNMLLENCKSIALLSYNLIKEKIHNIKELLTLYNVDEIIKVAYKRIQEMSIEENVKAAAKFVASIITSFEGMEKNLVAYYLKLESYRVDWKKLQIIIKSDINRIIDVLNVEMKDYNILHWGEGAEWLDENFDAGFLEELIFVMTPEPMNPDKCYIN